jgi:hypothetical protein
MAGLRQNWWRTSVNGWLDCVRASGRLGPECAFSAPPHRLGRIKSSILISIPTLGELSIEKLSGAPISLRGFEIEAPYYAGSVSLLQLIWVNERFTAPRVSP